MNSGVSPQLGLSESCRIVYEREVFVQVFPYSTSKNIDLTIVYVAAVYVSRQLAEKSIAKLKDRVFDDDEVSVASAQDSGFRARGFMIDRYDEKLSTYDYGQLFHYPETRNLKTISG
jgi:hypothetical protein